MSRLLVLALAALAALIVGEFVGTASGSVLTKAAYSIEHTGQR